ncbi:MAG: hypothetical protein LBU42_02640 [Prevotellaceae bacterium]|nr:hypothetical protein [Prevotellaceae bacterium]
MQVERSVTQHGARCTSLPLARSTRFPLCTDSAPRERQWKASSAGCAALACGYENFAPSGLSVGSFQSAVGSSWRRSQWAVFSWQ